MKINYKDCSKRVLLRKCLRIFSALSTNTDKNLSYTEVEILSLFMDLDYDKFRYQRFSKVAKKRVIEQANKEGWELTPVNVNNKLYELVKKDYLLRDEDKVIYLSPVLEKFLAAVHRGSRFEFNILFEVKEDDQAENVNT